MNLQFALKRLSEGPVPIIAGGTDFYPALLDKPAPLELIDVTQFDELKNIDKVDDGWRIGAGVTWSEIVRAELPPAFAALKSAATEVGSIQIQNRATVVGNICNASPAADGVPPLLALNASVELQNSSSTRVVPLPDFITGVRTTICHPDELITAIRIPAVNPSERSVFTKLGARKYLVISIAMLAVNIDFDESGRCSRCAIAVGSCSPVAKRLTELEQALIGTSMEDASLAVEHVAKASLDELSPIDDVRGSAAYRMSVVRSVLQRAVNSVFKDCLTTKNTNA